jgi:hypothetical protein
MYLASGLARIAPTLNWATVAPCVKPSFRPVSKDSVCPGMSIIKLPACYKEQFPYLITSTVTMHQVVHADGSTKSAVRYLAFSTTS